MAGGHQVHEGIKFQAQVAAWMATHALAAESPEELGLNDNVTITAVELETDAPVDDLIAKTSEDGLCFVNVKTNVTISNKPNSPLASVINQFVCQWIACEKNEGDRNWERPLDPCKDRFVIAVKRKRSAAFSSAAASLFNRARDQGGIEPKSEIAKTNDEIRLYDFITSLIKECWSRIKGNEPSEQTIFDIICLIHVISLDFEGAEKMLALNLLRRSVLKKSEDSEKAWTKLVEVCLDFGSRRSGGDRAKLREILRAASIPLKDVPEFASDIARLKEVSEETLNQLAHLACLKSPEEGGNKIVIERSCVEVLTSCAKDKSLLVIGDPGSGKSGALYAAALRLIEDGSPVVVLAVDRHPVDTIAALDHDLGIENSFLNVLSAWTTEKPGILLIDALDATRGGPSERVFQELLRNILLQVPGWNVIASIRCFDLRFGAVYRDLFRGPSPEPDYTDSDFSNIRHIRVPKLRDDELQQVWLASPQMAGAFEAASDGLRELLQSPFNLFLLSNILVTNKAATDISGISTQVDLLNTYWSRRVIGSDHQHAAREEILRNAVHEMINNRTLSAALSKISAGQNNSVNDLLSNGVLSPWKSRGDSIHAVTLSHHMLFDYAVARLVFEGGHATDLSKKLTDSDDIALLLAPAAIMALQMLWEIDDDHRDFWKISFEISGASGTGAFCRMLPARVAAILVREPKDFSRVIECIAAPNNRQREAALFILRHCFGVLIAGIVPRKQVIGAPDSPWPKITRNIADVAISDTLWPLKAVIADWVKDIDELPQEHRDDLAHASRLLLVEALNSSDEGSVVSGIQGVARTIRSETEKSIEILKMILEPDRVRQHGHKELFWLAEEFDYLLEYSPELLTNLYRAAYASPLPSKDEKSPMGSSRILSLVSNKRQDFEMARYRLGKHFSKFVETSPIEATQALIYAVDYHIKEEKNSSNDDPFTVRIGNHDAAFAPDYSYIWWWDAERNEHEGKDVETLLNQFIVGMRSVSQDDRDQDITSVVSTIAESNGWACLWVALMRAAATPEPGKLGQHLIALLINPEIIASTDGRKPAGDLISALYPSLPSKDKSRIEAAILDTDREEYQKILLGCLPADNIETEEARQAIDALKNDGPLPSNQPPHSFKISWGSKGDDDDDWWLRDEGVDLKQKENAELNTAIKVVEALAPPAEPIKARLDFFAENWSAVIALREAIEAYGNPPEALLMKAWQALASTAGKITNACEEPNALKRFPNIEKIIQGALSPSLWPDSEFDEERENAFAQSTSWGSPAPRIEAAGAIMALARTKGESILELRETIKALVADGSPAVRHQVLVHVNMLFTADPDLMWYLCESAFAKEKNPGVLQFFLSSLGSIIHARPEWASKEVLALDDHFQDLDDPDDGPNGIQETIAHILLRLWLSCDQESAGNRIRQWVKDPIIYKGRIQTVLTSLRNEMIMGVPQKPSDIDERCRQLTVEVFENAVSAAAPIFNELAVKPSRPEEEEKAVEAALRVLDSAATQIYFGSGAYNFSKSSKPTGDRALLTPEIRARFLDEMWPTLEALATVIYPSVTHHLLETLEAYIPDAPERIFKLLVQAIVDGGEAGGYQLENMGADLFVRIIRRYLADFRWVLTKDDECRNGLVRSLNAFVERGWPEARRLVYELPEMLR